MRRTGWDPTRRNRNLGTARSGHGQDNRLVIASPRDDPRPFWSRLGPHATVARTIWGRPVTFLVEPARASSVHACTVDDLFHMLELFPSDWYWVRLFILRQPKRKEQTLRSAWGRLAYGVEIGQHRGPAVILEAVDLSRSRRWPKSLAPHDVEELERLRADGHRITTTRHGHLIHTDLTAARATQLYRTLPHEIGHWVDYQDKVIMASGRDGTSEGELSDRYFQRPAAEREAFAHRYADTLSARLRARGQIPFERILDPDQLRHDGLRPMDFSADKQRAL